MYRIEGPEDGGKWPNGPRFGLIVVLFGVAIVVCLLLACLLLPHFAVLFHFPHTSQH
jgi:hypothetical protein